MKRNPKRGSPASTGDRRARRDTHLKIDSTVFEQFKRKCAASRVEMGTATELLWKLWIDGHVQISKPQAALMIMKADKKEDI